MNKVPFGLRPALRALLAAGAVATLVACQTVPDTPASLTEARAALRAAESNPAIATTAALELQQAREAVARAEHRWADDHDVEETRSLAHIARQRIAIAGAVAERQVAETLIQQATAERERVRAEVREREASNARSRAALARSEAERARSQAQRIEEQNRQLKGELEDLQARQTGRGLVVTLDDVLFDTGEAELRGGALRSLQRLAAVLRDQPDRRVVIEGYTDSQGSEEFNRDLAQRRADAVRRALLAEGVPPAQVDVRAFGEANPVASNDTAAGRQLNRRVEIVVANSGSRDSGR